MTKSTGRSWPLSIIGIFIFLSFMLFGILYISLKYVPVNRENVYQMGYQEVDKNFNELHEAQALFDKSYDVQFDITKLSAEPVETMRVNGQKVYFDHGLKIGENRFAIDVRDKNGKAVDNARLELLMTRFDTGEFDQNVAVAPAGTGHYESKAFTINREGRWKIVAKVSVGEKTGYFEKSVYAR